MLKKYERNIEHVLMALCIFSALAILVVAISLLVCRISSLIGGGM